MRRSKSTRASIGAVMAMLAGMGALPVPNEPDHSQRESNRMKLTDDELAKLETLSGKEKKAYVKELRAKYA